MRLIQTGILGEENKQPIELLIKGGADLMARNSAGMTPLIYAIQKGQENIKNIKTLICYSKEDEINKPDAEGLSPLHHLAKMVHAKKSLLVEITNVRMHLLPNIF